jgi:hypothetical protein
MAKVVRNAEGVAVGDHGFLVRSHPRSGASPTHLEEHGRVRREIEDVRTFRERRRDRDEPRDLGLGLRRSLITAPGRACLRRLGDASPEQPPYPSPHPAIVRQTLFSTYPLHEEKRAS